MTFLFDWMSLLFMRFAFIISSLVILYSDDYRFGDSILLGWDCSGLVSHLLVTYYRNVKSYGAGMLTVLCNWFSNVALLMVIAWIINFAS